MNASHRYLISEQIARLMSAQDRKKYGVQTVAEAKEESRAKTEKQEHQTFIDWGNLNGLLMRSDRMDKRTSGPVGWPDFLIVYHGRVLPLEFKVGTNKPSDAQKAMHERFARAGTEVAICYSADEAIRKTRGWLWEHFRWQPTPQEKL